MIGSSASERLFHASQSLFTLRPGPTHRVLANRSAEQRRQRAPHPPRIGAGQIAARDQRIGGKRTPLIGSQRPALPFRGLAFGVVKPGPRHRDLDRSERARQPSRPAAVAMARDASFCFIAGHLAASVARP